ncbi:MAG: excinuclease ABC subunit UvrC [Euryarchaeota archaeon]|nr:excinuclease ABC subunit UvrC [Euryarchaeota archaeon]
MTGRRDRREGPQKPPQGFDVRARARELPELPGVYQFLDASGKVLYIGKARNLRKRIDSYIRPHSWLIPAMLERARSLDYTVTKTDRESLILEASMVRHHKPRYNVKLKDDKRFPYLKLTKEGFPRLIHVRRTADDGATYFGPFTFGPINRTMRFVRRLFGLRPCASLLPRGCIYGDMGNCLAPCRGKCTQKEYAEAVGQAARYLSGEHRALLTGLEERMEELSERQEYEKAAAIRDQIRTVSRLAARQRVDFLDPADRDAIVVRRAGAERALALHYSIRGGIVVAKKHFSLDAPEGLGPGDVLEGFLTQYYGNASPPPEIMMPAAVPGRALVEDWLSSVAGRRVRLLLPKKGPRRRLLGLMESDLAALAAAMEGGKPRDGAYDEAAAELQKWLCLPRVPESIEAYDISTIQGTSSVGAKVRFENGLPAKSGYRRFRIKSVAGQDDFAMMGEVLSRRMGHMDDDPLPDLMLIDGGKGQLGAALGAMKRAGAKGEGVKGGDANVAGARPALAALAKREEEVFVPGEEAPLPIPPGSKARLLLQRVRDEAHRFAVGYHRKLRSRGQTGSALDRVEGLGAKKAAALLRRFSSVAGIRAASEDELRQVEGIGPKLARQVKETLG